MYCTPNHWVYYILFSSDDSSTVTSSSSSHFTSPSPPTPPAPPPGLLLFLPRYLNVFQPLQLGGVKEMSPLRRYRSFTGCIRNLEVDSQVSVCV